VLSGFGEVTNYAARVGSGSPFFNVDYRRDKAGRISNKIERVGAQTTVFDYGYDRAGRLTNVVRNGISVSEYGYDLNGNRTRSVLNGVEKIYLYDDQDRLLEVAGSAPEIPTTFEYSANGELFKKRDATGETTYQYDVFGNLKSVQQPNGTTIEYLTDPSHRRIGKRINGIRVQGFIYQSSIRISAEIGANNEIVSRFVYAGGVNVPSYMVRGGISYRLITDHLGSPRFVVRTSDGIVTQELDYDEFGNVILDTNPGFQPFGFAGGLYDPDTSLAKFGARDYYSLIGRWTSKDPIRFSSGLNFYNYVSNDPINAIDVLGLDAIYLLDSDNAAAVGQGHAGVIIGDDGNGWSYYSFAPKVGVNTTIKHYKTLGVAVQDSEVTRYEEFLRFKTSRLQDLKAKLKATQSCQETYRPFARNCGHIAGGIMKEAKPEFKVNSFRPKVVFEDNKPAADSSGTIDTLVPKSSPTQP